MADLLPSLSSDDENGKIDEDEEEEEEEVDVEFGGVLVSFFGLRAFCSHRSSRNELVGVSGSIPHTDVALSLTRSLMLLF